MTSPDVIVVGGGPAGATVATLLARRGRGVVLVERAPRWRWRACGVFSSPAAMAALGHIGLAPELLTEVARPIPAMRVEADGATFRLTYGAEGDVAPAFAVGFDRERLDDALLDLARAAGVDVRTGVTATGLALDGKRPRLTTRAGGWSEAIEARVVIGADGVRSTIARAAGVVRPARLGPRIGLTFHVVDPRPADGPTDARMVILPDAYCGLAPVPGGRVNVGIVLAGDDWRRRLSAEGAAAVAGAILAAVPVSADDPVVWADAEHTDAIEGAAPLGHRVARRAGHGWLLVGDAAGFLDPLTGEGMHRALVSAALAARAVEAHLDGAPDALDRYERAMTRRFRAKDVVTVLIQSFLARPAMFGHAARRLEHRGPVRDTMGLVIGDLVPATRALDPRFLLALLRP
jgi:flavin-dependent dehydrogenase